MADPASELWPGAREGDTKHEKVISVMLSDDPGGTGVESHRRNRVFHFFFSASSNLMDHF